MFVIFYIGFDPSPPNSAQVFFWREFVTLTMLKLIRGIWREFNFKRKNASVSFDSVLASFCIHRPSVWGPACSTRHLGHSRMCSSSSRSSSSRSSSSRSSSSRSSRSSSSKKTHQGFPIPDPTFLPMAPMITVQDVMGSHHQVSP